MLNRGIYQRNQSLQRFSDSPHHERQEQRRLHEDHLHRDISVGGGVVAQLAVDIPAPRPDRAVRLERVFTETIDHPLCSRSVMMKRPF